MIKNLLTWLKFRFRFGEPIKKFIGYNGYVGADEYVDQYGTHYCGRRVSPSGRNGDWWWR